MDSEEERLLSFMDGADFSPVIANALVTSDPPPDPSIGIYPTEEPRNSTYIKQDVRVRSYEKWNHVTVQRATGLADAGFFCLWEEDMVCCFHCGGVIHLPTDDPWLAHARHFGNCQFLLIHKGQQFVENVQGRVAQTEAGSEQQQQQQQGAPQTISVVGARAPITPRCMTLTAEPDQMALGLNIRCIHAATVRKLHTTGEPYLNSQQLVEAIQEDQLEEEDIEPSTSSLMDRRSESMDLPCRQEQQQERAGSTKECANVADALLRAATDCTATATETRREISEPSGQNTLTQRLQEENDRLKGALDCKVCMVSPLGVLFCPCGHVVCCVQCARNLRSCPVCRAEIKLRIRAVM